MSEELYRPVFHFTANKNWINDPNGLVYDNGVYHMFFQYDPESISGSKKSWGHAISTDMVNWTEQDIALNYDEYQMYSGSAAIDRNDTLGVKKNDIDPMILAYTANLCGQCIAYSNDGGKTFHKYEKNPVLANYDFEDRDPKILWHAETARWVMIFYAEYHARNARPGYAFFTSDNLIDWRYESEISGLYECPDLRRILVKGSEETKWVILCCNGDYLVGDFDGRVFSPQQELISNWRSYKDYATQTWSDAPRVSQIAWLISDYHPSMTYNQQMTFPVDLMLERMDDKYILTKEPIKEIELLYKDTVVINDAIITMFENPFENIKGNAFDITYEFEYNPFSRIYFETPNGMIEFGCGYNGIRCNFMWEDLDPINNIVKIRVLIDKSSLEIFGNSGKLYMPFSSLSNGSDKLRLFATRPTKLISATINIIN